MRAVAEKPAGKSSTGSKPSEDALDVIRYLERRIPVCPEHGVMTMYSRHPLNHNARYYRCETCKRTAKGTTRLV